MLPKGTAYSVVPTMKEAAPSALFSTILMEERLHIFMITALNATTGFSPITCNSSVSFWAMFFCKRMERILLITSFTTSNSRMISSSTNADIDNGLTIKLSPSVRSQRCCHNSSVINGMNGWSRCNKLSKKPIVASYTFRLMGWPYAGLIISRYQEENSSQNSL